MADSRGTKQPRQSDFDRVTFTQPPPRPSNEPTMPIDLLIPHRIAEERAAQTVDLEPPREREPPTSGVTPSPAPAVEVVEPQEPPKEKISAMLPAAMVERVKDIAFWERVTVAALVEEGLNVVLAEKERKHGGPYEKRIGDLKTGRPGAAKKQQAPRKSRAKKRASKR